MSFVASNVPVDANGHYSMTYAPARTGNFTIRYRSLDVSNQSTVLPATTVTVAPAVSGVSGNSSKLRRRKTYTFTGYVNPRVATTLRVDKYNTKLHQYRPYKTVKATIGTRRYSSGYKISARWKPNVAGSYRLSWLTGSPAGMTNSASGSRYVTVK
jgi:hypothetical protein